VPHQQAVADAVSVSVGLELPLFEKNEVLVERAQRASPETSVHLGSSIWAMAGLVCGSLCGFLPPL
jgi:hypothetical protein